VYEIWGYLTETAAKPDRCSGVRNPTKPGDALDGCTRPNEALVDLAGHSVSEQGVEAATLLHGGDQRLEIQLCAADAGGV
jgi:hypothetical protein